MMNISVIENVFNGKDIHPNVGRGPWKFVTSE